MRDDFCVFISSYNRAGDIPTIKTLKNAGYTGDWKIVIDSPEDKEPYYNEYGEDKVYYFSKDEVADEIDRADNFNRKDGILYFRYNSYNIAEELGYKYFIQLDDDYTCFVYRFDQNLNYSRANIPLRDLDDFLEKAVEFLEKSGIDTVALAQGGDFIGGLRNKFTDKVRTKRKAMNSFICSIERPIKFKGSINEDVNVYTRDQQIGKILLTINHASIKQEQTQQREGGMTDLYLKAGTYVKSFYSILYSPSCVKLCKMGNRYKRIHHKILWNNAVPKILPEKYKK